MPQLAIFLLGVATTSALRIPSIPTPAAAASALALSPLVAAPAFADVAHGDVVLHPDLGAAAIGLVAGVVFVGAASNAALHYGDDEGCLIHEQHEICGRLSEGGECVLSKTGQWVCA
ncbi:hypothetical protein EMIHUDRAFT_241609 [Emiliania huxleyi CCMP1516]|uniref:Uncharacterized protein n=2 Tax=Emiliania huxleyi TaxID=2903 RepID=A0A0D3JCA5_EMIH1|nr:hypothetical protein EMIHUDRAFT_241609 [Emiliania huxleyi CCMP1516]EOD21140.1 hypothetical protein EMIHUDRAFT_241609 [Emiliania huxleyi CCMP1516]|eukprot:XP_005773569.1 hypothetical protein EMIHUDRAFT_241609 [Emiliania huxleyi CCMP1516]